MYSASQAVEIASAKILGQERGQQLVCTGGGEGCGGEVLGPVMRAEPGLAGSGCSNVLRLDLT